jgi:hypothetical protein
MLCCAIEMENLSPMIGGVDNVTIHQLAFIDKVHMCIGDTVDVYRYREYLADVKPLYLILEGHAAEGLSMCDVAIYRIMEYLYGLPDNECAY